VACEAIRRLLHPQTVSYLGLVALIGFAGNELVAQYRIRVGRRIGSAALVADGLHARTDGLTSLAVLLGAGGVALGFPLADPIVGLVITVAILAVLRQAAASWSVGYAGNRLGSARVFHDETRRQVPAIVRPVLAVLRVSDFMTLYTDGAPEAAAEETGPGSGR
jgi:divalent metal cation (Fe/Co/Zn/Cd) transporter